MLEQNLRSLPAGGELLLFMTKIAPLESLFHKLGDLRTTPRKGVVMVVMRAAGCVTGDGEVDALTQNLDLVLKRLTESARGEVYRLHTLDYAFLLNETEQGAREFIPTLRVALFKIMSRLGAGQGKADGDGLLSNATNLKRILPMLQSSLLVISRRQES